MRDPKTLCERSGVISNLVALAAQFVKRVVKSNGAAP